MIMLITGITVCDLIFTGLFEAGASTLHLWIVSPLVAILVATLVKTKHPRSQLMFSLIGTLLALLATFAYYDVYTYEGIDGQIALTYVVAPFYQWLASGVVFLTLLFISRFTRN